MRMNMWEAQVQQSFWNILSVAVPVAGLLIGWMVISGGNSGDYAGRLGAGILFALAMGAICGLCAIAALVAIVRGESRVWLSILGLVGNLAVVLPVAGALLRR
jgi:hypothetical protein